MITQIKHQITQIKTSAIFICVIGPVRQSGIWQKCQTDGCRV